MRKKTGQIMFWAGMLYIFGASWLAMWWIAPVWRKTPIAEFEGTAWAFKGPIYMTIGLSLPLGIISAGIGLMLFAREKKPLGWEFYAFVAVILLASFSIISVPSLNYYPAAYGIMGFFIVVFFVASLWFWAKKRKTLDHKEAKIADIRLMSYVFFYMAANFSCTLLGNPISGLFFPEKVIQYNSLPVYYAMGLKQALYFALGFFFIFLSNCLAMRKPRIS
jgi:hypothetical protein